MGIKRLQATAVPARLILQLPFPAAIRRVLDCQSRRAHVTCRQPNTMNNKLILSLCALVLAAFGVAWVVKAQPSQTAIQRYECAMIKWDGPDRLAIIYPDRAEVLRVFKSQKPPADVSEEEFCLIWGANKLAQEGWEPVNLNSRRVLLRRPPAH